MELPLSQENHQAILSLYKQTNDKRIATYLNIILLRHKKYSVEEISLILNISTNTVYTWLGKFLDSPTLSAFLKLNYKGSIGKLSYLKLAKVYEYAKDKAAINVKQILNYILEQFHVLYTISGVTKLLKRLDFSYKQKVAIPSKLDVKEQDNFIKKYETIKKELTPNSALFFMDAAHPQHNTHTTRAWLLKGSNTYTLTNSGRNRLNINGLYNPDNQDVIVTYHATINAQATIELLDKLQENYQEKEKFYIIADNAKYYVSELMKQYLANHTKIQLIHLPPYSPNLNLIERLWKYMRKNVINNNYFEKFANFSKQIKHFFDNINEYKEELATFIGNKFMKFNAT